MKRVGISLKPNDERACIVLNELQSWLLSKGYDVLVDNEIEHNVRLGSKCQSMSLAAMLGRIDVMIVLGGDGTLLHAARNFIGSGTPILGINLGRLGFLTDTPVGSMFESLEKVLSGQSRTELHFSLQVEVWRGDKMLATGLAMNDVVIERSKHPRMIGFEMYIDHQFVFRMRGDGLILATPAGSTAYALSAGGPIVQPSVNAISVVPVCPHTLSNRPIVISAEDDIALHLVESELSASLNLDGQELTPLEQGDRVIVRKGADITLVYLQDRQYFNVLRNKLNWAGLVEKN